MIINGFLNGQVQKSTRFEAVLRISPLNAPLTEISLYTFSSIIITIIIIINHYYYYYYF